MSMKRLAPTASAKRVRSRIANAALGPCAPAISSRSRGKSSRDIGAYAIGGGSAGSTCGAERSVLRVKPAGDRSLEMPLVAIGARLRAICLMLPGAHEELMRRGPSYRVDDKIFALERPWSDWLALWCKVPQGTREIILGASPARFFIPPYFGAKGWIGVGLDEAADWREVEAFVHRSYRLIAPKRLAKLVA